MKRVFLSFVAVITICAIFSFTNQTTTSEDELRLDLDESEIPRTSDDDVDGIINTTLIDGGGARHAVAVEFCPGIGERCVTGYIDGAGGTVIVIAKKTPGGPDVVCRRL